MSPTHVPFEMSKGEGEALFDEMFPGRQMKDCRAEDEIGNLRRRIVDLEAFIDWIKEDPSRIGGDGWAEQVWWEERSKS